jgi:hypothetical protein
MTNSSMVEIHARIKPKHACWLNQIEIWFSILARKVIRLGNFTSTKDLKAKITIMESRAD